MGSGRTVENYVKAIWKFVESLDMNSILSILGTNMRAGVDRHTQKGRETAEQPQQNRKKGETREISPLELGFKSPEV